MGSSLCPQAHHFAYSKSTGKSTCFNIIRCASHLANDTPCMCRVTFVLVSYISAYVWLRLFQEFGLGLAIPITYYCLVAGVGSLFAPSVEELTSGEYGEWVKIFVWIVVWIVGTLRMKQVPDLQAMLCTMCVFWLLVPWLNGRSADLRALLDVRATPLYVVPNGNLPPRCGKHECRPSEPPLPRVRIAIAATRRFTVADAVLGEHRPCRYDTGSIFWGCRRWPDCSFRSFYRLDSW